MVSNIDIAPTMLELANIEDPDYIQGKSLKTILNGELHSVRDIFVYEGLGTYGGTKPNLTAITDDYRLIVTYTDESLEDELFRELYHQKDDIWEIKNLADDVEYRIVIDELMQSFTVHKKTILKQ